MSYEVRDDTSGSDAFRRLAELGLKARGNDDATASAMDGSRGASVEDVGQEESKRG